MLVWHPDRYCDNPRLRTRAEEMAKRINLALEVYLGRDNETVIPEVEREPEPFRWSPSERESRFRWVEEESPYVAPRPTGESGGGGCAGGLIIGGLIGGLFGGWGALPGAVIGGIIGGALGNQSRSAGEAIDETGGCALGCIGELISKIFETVVGCGCLLVIAIIIIAIIASLSH